MKIIVETTNEKTYIKIRGTLYPSGIKTIKHYKEYLLSGNVVEKGNAIEKQIINQIHKFIDDLLPYESDRFAGLINPINEKAREEWNARTKMKSYEKWFKELMACIHGDGGHYLSKHGIKKSTKDAINKHMKLVQLERETHEGE